MIISGNGSIPDNAFYKPGNGSSPTSDETIAKVTDNLKILEIEDGITSIGQYAFYKCTKLEKVIIKGDLVSSMTQPMGKYAFAVYNRNTTELTVEYYGTTPVADGTNIFYNRYWQTQNGSVDYVTLNVLESYQGNQFLGKAINDSNKTLAPIVTTIDASGATITLEDGPYTYTGSEIKPEIVAVTLGNTVIEDTDYTVDYDNNVNAGQEAEVIVTFQGNYSGVASKTFTIEKAKVDLTGITTSATSALPGNKIAVAVTYDNDLAGASIALKNDEQFTVDPDSTKVEEGQVTFIITLDSKLIVGQDEVEVEAIVANDNFQVVAPAIAKVKIGVTDNSDKIAKLEQDIANLEAKLNNKETALQTEIDALKAEISSLKATDVNLDAKIEAINKNIADLAYIYATKQELNDAKTELNAAIAQKADTATVNAKVDELNTAINNAKTAVEAFATAADAALKTELLNSIDTAKVAAIAAANEALNAAKTELNAAIAQKADATTLNEKVTELTAAINTAQAAAEAFATAADATLKEELLNSIDTAKVAAIAAADAALTAAKAELNAVIAQKADAATVNAKVDELTTAINNAKTAAEAFATAADATLKEELLSNIATAKNEAIAAADAALEEAKTALNAAIDKKADTATVNAKVAALTTAIANAEKAAKDYADVKDAALKEALEAKLTEANALINSLDSRMDTAEEAIAKLENAIKDLEQADAENEAAMKAAIETLNKAIADAKAFAEKSDAELKNALNEKINAAQTALEAKIAEIQANLDKAVEELKAADQANAEKLADAIARLKEAIAVAEAASAATDAVQDEHIIALKNEINRVAIDLEKAQANLEAALKAEVEAAIAKAKQEAIEAAKGHIPYIGENGNWWIGNSDTGVDANGIQGETGKDGITPQLRVGSGNIWEVSYDNGKTWTSLGVSAVGASGSNGRNGRDGKDGVDGKDGITPQLRINEDTNMWEISYDEGKTWESLGVVATGSDGADGANGADGITPQLRINEKTNMWEVSYDEGATWTSMGVKATGADGSSNILPLVISGISLAGMIAMLCIMLADRKKRGLPVG